MKPSGGNAHTPSKPATVITTSPMKRVEPQRPAKSPQLVAASTNSDALIETLRQHINDLEARIATLESVISVQNQDVVISAPKSVLIRGLDTVELSANGKLKIAASMTETNVPIAKFSGILECDLLKANTVMGASYTPGAGNIW